MQKNINNKLSDEALAEHWFNVKHMAFDRLLDSFKKSGLKQTDVAKRLGSDEARVSKWLRGKENLTLRTMSNLARALGYRLVIQFEALDQLKKSNFHLSPDGATSGKYRVKS